MVEPCRSFLMACFVALAWVASAHGQSQVQVQGEGTLLANPHQNFVQSFEGTKTCLACHEEEAKHAFGSIHYQWKAPAPNVVNSNNQKIGKINSTNDFCTLKKLLPSD
jgi:hypothetical protein